MFRFKQFTAALLVAVAAAMWICVSCADSVHAVSSSSDVVVVLPDSLSFSISPTGEAATFEIRNVGTTTVNIGLRCFKTNSEQAPQIVSPDSKQWDTCGWRETESAIALGLTTETGKTVWSPPENNGIMPTVSPLGSLTAGRSMWLTITARAGKAWRQSLSYIYQMVLTISQPETSLFFEIIKGATHKGITNDIYIAFDESSFMAPRAFGGMESVDVQILQSNPAVKISDISTDFEFGAQAENEICLEYQGTNRSLYLTASMDDTNRLKIIASYARVDGPGAPWVEQLKPFAPNSYICDMNINAATHGIRTEEIRTITVTDEAGTQATLALHFATVQRYDIYS